MKQSPCLHCPNRHQDKNRCLESCDLIHRRQTFQTQYREHACYSAVDSSDEGRYRIMTAFDLRPTRESGLSNLPY